MYATLTMEEFSAVLKSERESSPLLEALRKLTTLEKPEDVRIAESELLAAWSWRW